MTNSSHPDVVIVGAGVIGCATAYFLGARHGLRCLVLERDGIASQASGGAAGELSPFIGPSGPEPYLAFCGHGLRLHREMAPVLVEESGIDYRLTETPIYRPAFTEEEAEELRRALPRQRELGLRAAWLDGPALRARKTLLSPATLGATYTEDEFQLETYPFALALARAAEQHGASFQSGEVTGLIRHGERATGVLLPSGPLAAGAVVLAMGPWTQFAAPWLGFSVPVEPLRGQIVHLRLAQPPPAYAIFHPSGYVLPKPNGRVYIGTTAERVGFDRRATTEAREGIIRAVLRLAPNLADAQVLEVTACLRPLSLDDLPIIGPAPGWEGLYLATGHGRKGILLSLATGKYLAQQIAEGRSDYPLDLYSPARLLQSPSPVLSSEAPEWTG